MDIEENDASPEDEHMMSAERIASIPRGAFIPCINELVIIVFFHTFTPAFISTQTHSLTQAGTLN
jgi:hypothetical protein